MDSRDMLDSLLTEEHAGGRDSEIRGGKWLRNKGRFGRWRCEWLAPAIQPEPVSRSATPRSAAICASSLSTATTPRIATNRTKWSDSATTTEFYSIVTNRRRVAVPRSPADALQALSTLLALPGMQLLPTPAGAVARWMALLATSSRNRQRCVRPATRPAPAT